MLRRGSTNAAELNHLLTTHVLIRRLKKNVLKQLPMLRRSRISVAPDPAGLQVCHLSPYQPNLAGMHQLCIPITPLNPKVWRNNLSCLFNDD